MCVVTETTLSKNSNLDNPVTQNLIPLKQFKIS